MLQAVARKDLGGVDGIFEWHAFGVVFGKPRASGFLPDENIQLIFIAADGDQR
jgi:hypothetical protein